MKLVILSAVVAAAFGAACIDFTAVPTGYTLSKAADTCASNTVTAGAAYTLTDLNGQAGAGKTAGAAVDKVVCAAGYTTAATGIKIGACADPATLVGCTKTVEKTKCAAKEIAAVADKYDAVSLPECADGKMAAAKCSKAKNSGTFKWACTGGTGTTAGTWSATPTGACAAAVWVSATNADCPIAKKGVEASKKAQTCSTGTASDCTGTATEFDCVGGADTDDPTCDTADLTGFCGASAQIAGGATKKQNMNGDKTYTCKLTNKADGVKGVTAAWAPPASSTDLSCGGSSAGDGSSAGTVSTFFAVVVAVIAYMW